MAKGEKYKALTEYLTSIEKNEIKMTFSEVENVLGFRLPESSYKYPTLWSNSKSHPIAFGWLNAGFMTRQVNISHQTVEFFRASGENISIELMGTVAKSKTDKISLSVQDAVSYIHTYFQETVKDPHGRFMSWVHCYNTFKVNRRIYREDIFDYLALHLAFYLASWGMYRGSSFLLQKDYKVHIPIVKIITEKKYDPLMGISAENLMEDANLDLLEDVCERIRKAYALEQPAYEGTLNNATDTLVTKILLGSLGCVPAYDRYYVQAVRRYGISTGIFNRESIRDVAKYYMDNKDMFEDVRLGMSSDAIEYPMMKVMDMCMWQAAFSNEVE